MALYKDRGIVLSGFRLGEADRVLGILTLSHGKVRAVAKGVRRTKSRIGGRLEPLTHVDLVIYAGKNLDTVTSVEIIDSFRSIHRDYGRLTVASSMAEGAERFSQEHEPCELLYKLLLAGLREVDANPPTPLLLTGYLLRLMEISGFAMLLSECAGCGAPPPHSRVSLGAGGVVCASCDAASFGVSTATVAMLDALSRSRMAEANAFEADPGLVREASGLVLRFVEYHLDRRLRSMALVAIPASDPGLVQT